MEFEKMLEQYMDNKEIDKKLKLDKKEMKSERKSEKKKSRRSDFINTIPIRDFVTDYLGTEHDCEGLRHIGLKSFKNPYVVGISNDFALKNPDCVVRREILVVMDDYNNPGAYINPEILKNIETMEQYKYSLSLLEKVSLHSLENINKLYNEYNSIICKIDELENAYINGIDLLRCLEVKKIIKKIRKYVLQANEKSIEFSIEQNDMQQNMSVQKEILKKLERALALKEEHIKYEDYIEDEYDFINSKINRQKSIVQRGRRSTIRKGV